MTKADKAIERLKSQPKDFTYEEAKALLEKLGYEENNKGKTSGSRAMFYREKDGRKTLLHKPHPRKYLLPYQVKNLLTFLKESGDIE